MKKSGWKKISSVSASVVLILIASGTVLLFSYLNFTHRASKNCAFKIPDTLRPPKNMCVVLEKADTEEKRVQGLSGRKNMAPTQGMLFVFEQSARQCIWMKDMHLSLDILWLDESGKILTIRENITPETYPEKFCNDGKYVGEVLAGTVDRANLAIGQQLNL